MNAPNPLKTVATEELEAMLAQTSGLIKELEAELERRRQTREAVEIGRLEQHLAEARPSWEKVTQFFALVLQELRR